MGPLGAVEAVTGTGEDVRSREEVPEDVSERYPGTNRLPVSGVVTKDLGPHHPTLPIFVESREPSMRGWRNTERVGLVTSRSVPGSSGNQRFVRGEGSRVVSAQSTSRGESPLVSG